MRLVSVPTKGTRKFYFSRCYHKEQGFKDVVGEVVEEVEAVVDEGAAAAGEEEAVVIAGGEEEAAIVGEGQAVVGMVGEVDEEEEAVVEDQREAQHRALESLDKVRPIQTNTGQGSGAQ